MKMAHLYSEDASTDKLSSSAKRLERNDASWFVAFIAAPLVCVLTSLAPISYGSYRKDMNIYNKALSEGEQMNLPTQRNRVAELLCAGPSFDNVTIYAVKLDGSMSREQEKELGEDLLTRENSLYACHASGPPSGQTTLVWYLAGMVEQVSSSDSNSR